MIKRRIKQKNPYFTHEAKNILKNLDSNINFKFIGEGNFGESYYFKTINNILYRNIILKPNEYILKLFTKGTSLTEIKYLTKLSKYGLIPKIYYINDNFIIMKYINGETLTQYKKYKEITYNDIIKIDKLIRKWHQLGFAHGDLSEDNILITTNQKIYFIDPYFENKNEFDFDLDRLKYYWNKYL